MIDRTAVEGGSFDTATLDGEHDYDLYFGPAHSGSGNFGVKMWMKGEMITRARADPGYLHRGFEKLMEYRTPLQNAVLSDRICILEALNWNLLHAEAVEELMNVEVPERAQYIRVIMAELSRIQSHLIWYGVLSKALGFESGFMIAFGWRDYILDIFELVTGGRVYPAGYICPGGVRRDLPEGTDKKISKLLQDLSLSIMVKETDYLVLLDRLRGAGVVTPEDILRFGATGPVMRGSGMGMDVRKEEPYEVYDRFDFDVPVRKEGDGYSRLKVGIDEIEQSRRIVEQALEQITEGRTTATGFEKPKLNQKIPEGEVYVRNEIARGEGGIYMVSDGGTTPYRVKIRGPDFIHMIPLLEHLLIGSQIADVPAIYWSLNICPADMDR